MRGDAWTYFADYAWLGGDAVTRDVAIEVADGRIVAVRPGAPRAGTHLRGVTLPGLANAHSHAFQRALRGRTQRGGGSFWTWREDMYALAATMTPDRCFELARGTYAEMLRAGITTRRRVRLPALLRRADRGGERGRHPAHAARRVLPRRRVRRAAERRPNAASATATRRSGPSASSAIKGAKVGAAIHSVRAVPPDQLATVVEFARGKPLHFHVSEQRAENEACLAAHGRTPVQLLAEHGALGPDCTASTPPTCTRPTTWARPRSACARRPSATSPTASGTPARGSRSAATATRSSTCSRRRARWSSTCG